MGRIIGLRLLYSMDRTPSEHLLTECTDSFLKTKLLPRGVVVEPLHGCRVDCGHECIELNRVSLQECNVVLQHTPQPRLVHSIVSLQL